MVTTAMDSPKMKVAISVAGVIRRSVRAPQCGQRMSERLTSRWHPTQTDIDMVACSPLSPMQELSHL